MTTTVFTPATLPKNDNINRYAYSVEVDKQIFIRKGKMIAYYGNLRFERLGSTVLEILVSEAFNSPLFVNDFICVVGRGQLILGDLGNDIAGYDLDNANLTVRATHLLGFHLARHRAHAGIVQRSSAFHGAAVPRRRAGAARLGRLPLSLVPLRLRIHQELCVGSRVADRIHVVGGGEAGGLRR